MSSRPASFWRESMRGRRNKMWPPATRRSSPRGPRSKLRPRNSTARNNSTRRTTPARPRLERAEAQFKATQAQVSAQLAQAGAARAQSGFFVVKAPYGGVVSEVPVMLGDMAMPGRPLLTIYDPAALRVTAAVPQTDIARIASGKPTRSSSPDCPPIANGYNLPVLPCCRRRIRAPTPRRSGSTFSPAAEQVTPGTFARVWLPLQGATNASSVCTRQGHRASRGNDGCVCDRSERPPDPASSARGPRGRRHRSKS